MKYEIEHNSNGLISSIHIEFESVEEVKAFKRILHHAEADFRTFPNLGIIDTLKNDYQFLNDILCEL